ncbi:MAG: aminopeptidase [Corallococcus sp.]|nr:aminopeptidase [Corallococcus sp.]MCM1358964.1 aminopeptidase [Corallococcus sp.]MCM1394953.1 aminopeptidase [Corallococcus sp.]
MLNNKQMENFAELAVKVGVNMQRNQEVVIRCDVKCAHFAHLIAQKAYDFGAKHVIMEWGDEELSRINMLNASQDALCDIPRYQIAQWDHYIENKCCLISISAGNPNVYTGCDAEKLAAYQVAFSKARNKFRNATMSNFLRWTIVSVPTPEWASKVFPNDPVEVAVDKMWNAIGHIMRLDTPDPTAAWKKHIETLHRRANFLNEHNFEYIRLRNGRGTDLTVGLAKDHLWLAAEEEGQDGIPFTANMPTEEIFTAPHNKKIDGKVVNALPLVFNGSVIDDFEITFEKGKVVNYKADMGFDVLKGLLESDEGVLSLGEIALIGKNSPIAESGILFFNTLFDENASCHLAFGASYPTTVKGGNDLTDAQKAEHGMNQSLQHVDFMIGTKDLDVDGIAFDGKTTPLFRNGEWVI